MERLTREIRGLARVLLIDISLNSFMGALMRETLLRKIKSAVIEDDSAPAVVGLDEYFVGNDQEDCIAPNQVGDGRPPLKELYQRFRDISGRSDVQTVLVGIHDDWTEAEKFEDIWPAGDMIHIYTSASKSDVEKWIVGLAADGVIKGWPHGKHKNAPELIKGFSVYTVVWD